MRWTLTDLMIFADLEGEPRRACKNDAEWASDELFLENGDKVVIIYDDGVNENRVEIEIKEGN